MGGVETLVDAVVEQLEVTDRLDVVILKDDGGGDFVGVKRAGLHGRVPVLSRPFVERIDQGVDGFVVVIFSLHQAHDVGVHLDKGRDDLGSLTCEFLGVIGTA